MHLATLQASFKNGKISKQQYIKKMHKRHGFLFEYREFIKSTDIAKIEISDDRISFTSRTHGIKMHVNPNDKRTTPIEILNFGAFEKNEFPLLLQLVDKGDSFFDIGANIGWVSISVAKIIKNVAVFAFEPVCSTYDFLRDNIKLNNVKNIKTYNFGFAEEEKEFTFYFNPNDSGSASLANTSMNDEVQQITCIFKTLDNFIKSSKAKIDFIKCDVEGSEILVFKGGLKAIEKSKPIIFAEMLRKWTVKFHYTPNDTIGLLKKIGYNCYTASGETLTPFFAMDEKTIQTNFFFLHKEKHREKIARFVENKI